MRPIGPIPSNAKINLGLRVTAKRADGYHDLETIFQTISLHDTLTFREAPQLTLTCSDPSIPTDDRNLVVRAARLLGAPPVAIHLEKRIPAGGGLGGGSSNAATTLRVLSQMFGIESGGMAAALQIGSDVPFFLMGGTAYATGRGEVLTPLPDLGRIPLVLLFPEEGVSTARAYALLRRFSPPLGLERVQAMVVGGLFSYATELINDFEEPIFALLPHLGTMKTRLYELGAMWAAMSGSGSTIVGAFRDAETRDAALAQIDGVRAVAAETAGATAPAPG